MDVSTITDVLSVLIAIIAFVYGVYKDTQKK